MNYETDENGDVYAGRFKEPPVPTWIVNQPAKTWGIVPLVNKWSDVDPSKDVLVNPNYPDSAPWKGISSFNSRVTAWNGHTSHNGIIYDPPAGGHGDYAGNESYKCDLNSEMPTVIRLTNPSGAIGNEINLDDGLESTGLYSDGKPRSPHNYNTPVFYPPTNEFILAVLGNGLYKSGQSGIAACARFNAETGYFNGLSATAPSGVGTLSPMGSCYDPNRELIWFRGAGTARFTTINLTTNEWVNRGSQVALSGSLGFCYIPDYDVIFIINTVYTNNFAVFDCTTYEYYYPEISGSFLGVTLTGTCQPVYLGNGNLAIWDNTEQTTTINTIKFDGDPRTSSYIISQLEVAAINSVTPTVKATNGTYGRFQWHPTLGIFTLLNGMNQDLYFFKV